MSKESKSGLSDAKGLGNTRRVFVRDLEVVALLGVHEKEKVHPQRILVNIDLTVREEAEISDDISKVVSYEILVQKVERIVAQGHLNLAETLAERIALDCLADNRVVSARVRIEKPDIIPNTRSVGIEIERAR